MFYFSKYFNTVVKPNLKHNNHLLKFHLCLPIHLYNMKYRLSRKTLNFKHDSLIQNGLKNYVFEMFKTLMLH